MKNQRSIRRTLLVWQVGALLLLGVIATGVTFLLAERTFEALRNIELTQIADAIARHGIDSDTNDEPGDFLSQVWEADGTLAFASQGSAVPKPETLGHYDFSFEGHRWHGYTARYQGLTILVAREVGARNVLFQRLLVPMLTVVIGLTLLLAVLTWELVGRTLGPLVGLQQELTVRQPAALTPLPDQNLPRELMPLVETLNGLFARVESLLDAHRRFVADAAHELRTPVTAVKLYAQLAQRSEDREAREDAMEKIQASCSRATHLVEQLLTLARLEPENAQAPQAVSLDALARDVVIDQSALAEAKQIDLGIARTDPESCLGHADDLRILLNNLVGNAIHYTPSGGQIDVSVLASGNGAELRVEDTGPGIPIGQQERVFDRFHRLASADQPGNGLGLAIVKRIADRHGAQILLANRETGGLQVRVVFPSAPLPEPSQSLPTQN